MKERLTKHPLSYLAIAAGISVIVIFILSVHLRMKRNQITKDTAPVVTQSKPVYTTTIDEDGNPSTVINITTTFSDPTPVDNYKRAAKQVLKLPEKSP